MNRSFQSMHCMTLSWVYLQNVDTLEWVGSILGWVAFTSSFKCRQRVPGPSNCPKRPIILGQDLPFVVFQGPGKSKPSKSFRFEEKPCPNDPPTRQRPPQCP